MHVLKVYHTPYDSLYERNPMNSEWLVMYTVSYKCYGKEYIDYGVMQYTCTYSSMLIAIVEANTGY